MHFDHDIYYGKIIKGDLHGAINYVKQFPEHASLYDRFMDVFENERYITSDLDPELNDILLAYYRYYRDVFYLRMEKEQAENLLRDRLAALLDMGRDTELGNLEQNVFAGLFQSHGLHFLGGKTGGYYGPYIWRSTETVTYEVELPHGVQTYAVKLLDGFLARSWIDFLSFGEIGTGGWTDGDGFINCVKSAWDFESEHFQVSLLKHEAQHVADLAKYQDLSSETLEYLAKLVELIYSRERNLLPGFAKEADPSDAANGHALAAYRITHGFAAALGMTAIDPTSIPISTIQTIAKQLFDESERALLQERKHADPRDHSTRPDPNQ